MEIPRVRLRDLSVALRVAISALLLVLAGGTAASFAHIKNVYDNKDERPGLSYDDVATQYHGIVQTSALLESIQGKHCKELLQEDERQTLLRWLEGDTVSESYDSLELGDSAPAEILDRSCVTCHAREPENAAGADGIGERVPLEYWDDVERIAFRRERKPIPVEILTVSTHTHALSMPLIASLTTLLFLATSWPRWLTHGSAAVAGVGLLADLSSWWLARFDPLFSYAVMGGGALFGGAILLQIGLTLLHVWFGRRSGV